jgi:hypothetical protein
MGTYKVTVEFEFYVDCATKEEALRFCREAADDMYLPEYADVEEVKTAPKEALDWHVYGTDNMTVREVLNGNKEAK